MRDEQTMNTHAFSFAGTGLVARPSGALYWESEGLLAVSDLHLGKSERVARRSGQMLPPYEVTDTLSRLDAEIAATAPKVVVCLGDSFDDLAAFEGLAVDTTAWIHRMMAGRRWVWIAGNHDPAPVDLAGTHLAELVMGPLVFRHIAQAGAHGEVSGHYHPKATLRGRGRSVTRACFLRDSDRVLLPAFGTYTGGLRCTDPVLQTLMRPDAVAVMTGRVAQGFPMPRVAG